MKKTIIILSICFLFASMSFASALPIPKIKNLGMRSLSEISADSEDAPEWAIGNFTGSWGVDIWGNDWFTVGPFYGYYSKGFLYDFKVGRFMMEYKEDGDENGTIIEGLFIGPYLLGVSTDIYTENTSAFVGIGGYNETNFRWRIMGMEGPTIFMKGTFNEF